MRIWCLTNIISITCAILIFVCTGLAASRGPDEVSISDFDAIRSITEPHLDSWLDQAEKATHGECRSTSIDVEPLTEELFAHDVGIIRIVVHCREDESGTPFRYVEILTEAVHGWSKGYIYNPSGMTLDWPPTKQIEESWFVFTEVD
jgi:hypothetical protein